MDWNKDHIREALLLLETAALHSARENYLDCQSASKFDQGSASKIDQLISPSAGAV